MKKRPWKRILLWFAADLLLIIPICLLLFYFGQIIEQKREEAEPSSISEESSPETGLPDIEWNYETL